MPKRRKSRIVKIGQVKIGGNFPIAIQSMTNTKTSDIKATVRQIKELEKAGCEIIRLGIPDMESAKSLSEIKKRINIPLIADIHFSASLALESINQGVDKLRINPGNFPKRDLEKVVNAAKKKKIPIRIGINAGSLEKGLLKKYNWASPKAMVESAIKSIRLMEKLKFYDLVIALKASDVLRTIKAYEILSKKVNYPFHLGVTEAGTEFSGTIKSAIGIGALLLEGIGDTIRVSLSSDPVKEVMVAWEILKDLELRKRGVEITSCPTCARADIDVIKIAKQVEEITSQIKEPIKVAIMGCVVNGLGEAKEADIGIIGTGKLASITRQGKIIKQIKKKDIIKEFKKELKQYLSRF